MSNLSLKFRNLFYAAKQNMRVIIFMFIFKSRYKRSTNLTYLNISMMIHYKGCGTLLKCDYDDRLE